MLLILVQIQAGPPAFAGSASYGSASPSRGEGCRGVAERSESEDPGVGKHLRFPLKSRLMARFWGFRGCGNWSKDHPRARVTRALGLGDAQHARPFFVPKIQSES